VSGAAGGTDSAERGGEGRAAAQTRLKVFQQCQFGIQDLMVLVGHRRQRAVMWVRSQQRSRQSNSISKIVQIRKMVFFIVCV
jgi:hypothetical protein